MATGRSLHIGVNSVDPDHYSGWDGALKGCEHDAHDMEAIAAAAGLDERTLLLTKEATAERVLDELKAAAAKTQAGDLFVVTFAGHGGQAKDVNGDEDDGADETLLLFDRMLFDDELWQCWSAFPAGARILLIADCCHSGTNVRAASEGGPTRQDLQRLLDVDDPDDVDTWSRGTPDDVAIDTYLANRDTYDAIQTATPSTTNADVAAAVVSISACQDKETAADGKTNGLFTKHLKAVWADGTFAGSHQAFKVAIEDRISVVQHPNLVLAGAQDRAFYATTPFRV